MSTITAPAPAVNAKSRPLTVELLLTINGQAYHVEPTAHAPGGTRSYRLAKRGGDEAVYDVDAHADRIECACPSYQKSHAGTSSLCKHGRAMVMVGLVDYPDETADAARAAYDSAREKLAAIAEAESVVRSEAENQADVITLNSPAPVAPAFDADFYRAQNAVAERRALWLSHRHLHTSDPLPAAPDHARDIVLIDDDGTLLPTFAEIDQKHKADHEAKVAEVLEGRPFLPACCPDDEILPCAACLSHDGPADLSDDAWDDSHRWETTDFAADPDDDGPAEPPARSMAVQVDDHARELRAIGSPLGDLLAERAESLAAQIRLVEATNVEQFRDRLDCLLDAEAERIRARHAACC
jgi:hypothetical protein